MIASWRFNLGGAESLLHAFALPFYTETRHIIIKGVLSTRDALRAAEIGASRDRGQQHGWGSFDFGVPSMMALPGNVEAVGNRTAVLVDKWVPDRKRCFQDGRAGCQGSRPRCLYSPGVERGRSRRS